MDVKLNSTNENIDDGNVDKPQLPDSNTMDLQAHIKADSITTGTPIESNLRADPRPLRALLPSSTETCTVVYEVNQPFTSMSRSKECLKTTSVHAEPDEDLCAAVLLACLFCHPLDCLLSAIRGCGKCVWSLCAYVCGCEPVDLQPLLEVTHHCDLCRCAGQRCLLSDCEACDICLQATECLDLAMEISQMIYH